MSLDVYFRAKNNYKGFDRSERKKCSTILNQWKYLISFCVVMDQLTSRVRQPQILTKFESASLLQPCLPCACLAPRSASCVFCAHPIASVHFSCLLLSCLVQKSSVVLSCHVFSRLVSSCLVLSCLVLSWLVLSCLVLSCFVLSCVVVSCLVLS